MALCFLLVVLSILFMPTHQPGGDTLGVLKEVSNFPQIDKMPTEINGAVRIYSFLIIILD